MIINVQISGIFYLQYHAGYQIDIVEQGCLCAGVTFGILRKLKTARLHMIFDTGLRLVGFSSGRNNRKMHMLGRKLSIIGRR